MIVGRYKMHINEINVKNKVHNYYYENLVKGKKLKTKNILIDEEKL